MMAESAVFPLPYTKAAFFSSKHYTKILDLVLNGKINIKKFTKIYPLEEINSVFELVNNGYNKRRPILVP